MLTELVEHSIKNRNKLVSFEELTTAPRDFEAYTSHFPFDNDAKDYVALKGSISGYSGKQHCLAFVIDIDNSNLELSHFNARMLVDRLVTEYSVPSEMFDIAFSGSKGFHITLSAQLFGGFTPAVRINEKIKELVKILTAGVPGIDLSIYDSTRVVRMKNSVNQKSGLYKIPLTFTEFLAGIEPIKEMANAPRLIKPTRKSPVRPLVEMWLNIKEPNSDAVKVEAEQDGFFAPPTEGNRNNQLFKQACFLFDYSNLDERKVAEIIRSINLGGSKPLPKDEINAVIASAKARTGERAKKVQAFTLDELMPEWFDYMKPENKPFSLLDSDFDREIRNKLMGKVIPIVGYPGTKKSLFALNILRHNMVTYGARGLYSNMEMSGPEIVNRAIDTHYSGNGCLASEDVERFLRDDQERGIALYKSLVHDFGNKMYVCNDSQLTVSDYEILIRDIEGQAGTVDFLIVDGLSMMGGTGTDTERVNKHTAELKALANKTGVCVIPIVHLSKGLELHSRELLKNARDSQKIADNGDYFIMLSMCADSMSQGDEIEYNESLIYARFWAKRGTGKRVSKIFEFEENMLRMRSTPYDPKIYDPVIKRGKKQVNEF